MDAATLSQKVSAGYAKAASAVGLTCQQYRPSNATAPLSQPLGTLLAAFDQNATFALTKPWDRTKAAGFVLADISGVLIGDYLIAVTQRLLTLNGQPVTLNGQELTLGGSGETQLTLNGQPLTANGVPLVLPGTGVDGTTPNASVDVYFVTRIEGFRPAEVVLCNSVLSFVRPQQQTAAGQGSYGGRTQASDVALATAWPASILIKGRGENPPARLPIDVRSGSFEVLLPAIPGISLQDEDRITDAVGTEYVIYTVEISPWGYRLMAGVATT